MRSEETLRQMAGEARVIVDLSRLREVVEQLRTQDNACTAEPLYIVQQEERVYGLDTTWGGPYVWLHSDEATEVDAEGSAKLEAAYQETLQVPEGYTRTGYVDRWEFVTATLTYQAALDYIEHNAHRHRGKLRVFVESGYRNPEWQWLRRALPELLAALEAQAEIPIGLDWRPIDTAPDDTRVLLYSARDGSVLEARRSVGDVWRDVDEGCSINPDWDWTHWAPVNAPS